MTYSMVPEIAAAFTAGGRTVWPYRGVDGVTPDELAGYEAAPRFDGVVYLLAGRTVDVRESMSFDSLGLIRAGTAVMQCFSRSDAQALDKLHEWLCVLYNDQTTANRPMTAPTRAPFDYQGVRFWRFRPKGDVQDQAVKYADWYVAEQLIEYAAKKI